MKKLIFRIALSVSLILALSDCGGGSQSNTHYEEIQEENIEEAEEEKGESASERADRIDDYLKGLSEETSDIQDKIQNWMDEILSDPQNNIQPSMISSKVNSYKRDLSTIMKKLDRSKEMIKEADLMESSFSIQIKEISTHVEVLEESLERFEKQYRDSYYKPEEEKKEVVRKIEEKSEKVTSRVEQGKTCYYIIASKKQLKEYKLTDKSFLKMSNLPSAPSVTQYFTSVGMNNLKEINLNSSKFKILTSQDKGSAFLVSKNPDGTKKLEILDPSEFWGSQNFLVIQID